MGRLCLLRVRVNLRFRRAYLLESRLLDSLETMRRFKLVLPIVLLSLLCGGASIRAQDAPDPREMELEELRREIGRLKERLGEMASRESGIEADLARTRIELELQEAELDEATTAYDLAAARAQSAAAKVEELTDALENVRGDLKRRLAGLYRLGRQGYLRLFLSLDPDRELLPAIRQLRYLVRRDQVTLERYRETREALAEERIRLEAETRAMEEWQRRETERRDELVRMRRRQERLLERVARERRTLAERAEALADKERKLSRLITSLVGEDAEGLDDAPIQGFRGALDWPVGRGAEVEVLLEFGPRRDPRYKTEVPHNGVDLGFDGAEDIVAVYPGQVLYASTFEGYGRMVVIHHPGRVFTLYSGLDEVTVTKGDVIPLDATIGRASGKIYFEIRNENQPEDPLRWLR